MIHRLVVCSLVAALLAIPAFILGAAERVAQPSFLLIGGGLQADNTAVLKRLLVRTDTNKIVIVPYASGDPDSAVNSTVAMLKTVRPAANFVVLPDPDKDQASRDLAAQWIGHADLVFFTGGDQGRLTPRLVSPTGQPGPVLQALQAGMLRYATPVAGTSAGAAAMADTMFTGGNSQDALTGERGGVRLGPGLGLVPGVVIDTHTLSRGRFGRMVAALQATGHRFAIGLADNRAAEHFGGTFRMIGDAAAVVIDAKELDCQGLARRGLRLSLLGDGDVLNPWPQAGAHVPVAGSEALGSPAPRVECAPESDAWTSPKRESQQRPEPWDDGELLALIHRLAIDPAKPQSLRGSRFVITLSADERTRWYMERTRPESLRAFDMKLTIEPVEP